jgi:hypothetical protein
VLAIALVLASVPRPASAEPSRSVERYRGIVASGTAAFAAGRFGAARAAFEAAYAIHPDPVLVFNIASCWRRAGDAEQALAEYHRFLTLAPPHDARRPLATVTIASLEQDLRPAEPAPLRLAAMSAPPAAPQAAPRRSRLRPLWIGLGALGGLGAVTGLVELARASAFDGSSPAPAPVPPPPEPSPSPSPFPFPDGDGGWDGNHDGGGDHDGGGWGGGRLQAAPADPVAPANVERSGSMRRALLLGVSSAALIAASVTVYYLDKRAERRALRLTVSSSGDGGGVLLGGQF